MLFEVNILGSSSATPTSTRYPSAQLVNLLGRFFLFDCGEGTQIQLRKLSFKIQKIQFICISHLHGDHYLGLIGLLSTMSLLNRKKENHTMPYHSTGIFLFFFPCSMKRAPLNFNFFKFSSLKRTFGKMHVSRNTSNQWLYQSNRLIKLLYPICNEKDIKVKVETIHEQDNT